MNVLRVLLAAAAIGLSGLAITSLLQAISRFLRLAISATVGVVIWGASFLPVLFLATPTAGLILCKDLALALAAGAVLLARRASRRRLLPSASEPGLTRAQLGTLIVLIVAAALGFAFSEGKRPEGDWDAWAIWNVRARFLYRSGSARLSFDPQLTHADYPPLLPCVIAQGWIVIGRESVGLPIAVAAFFAIATAANLAAALAQLRDGTTALLGAAILLGTPQFLLIAEKLYADVPLSLLALTAFALIAIVIESTPPKVRGGWVVTGIVASAGALMKNEGILVLLSVFVAVVFVRRPGSKTRVHVSDGFAFAAGVAPLLLILIWFKSRFAPPNDLFASDSASVLLSRVTDPSRYKMILQAAAVRPFRLGDWNVFLAGVSLVVFLSIRTSRGASGGVMRSALGLIIAGYGMVYLISPHPLKWHLVTSMDRLLMQCWPAMILIALLQFPPKRVSSDAEVGAGGKGSSRSTTIGSSARAESPVVPTSLGVKRAGGCVTKAHSTDAHPR